MSRSPAVDLAPLIKLLQAGVPPNRAATELSRVLAIWTVELLVPQVRLRPRLDIEAARVRAEATLASEISSALSQG